MPRLRSKVRWENAALDAFRREMAPSPRRWHGTITYTVVYLAATTLWLALHVPLGYLVAAKAIRMAPLDLGASWRRAVDLSAGCWLGVGIGVLLLAASAGQPWLLGPMLLVVFGGLVFFGLTSATATLFLYISIGVYVMIKDPALPPHAAIADSMWYAFGSTAVCFLYFAVQRTLWPVDPQALLLESLRGRLTDIASSLRRLAELAGGPPTAAKPLVERAGMSAQLDLLARAEAISPQLRERHTELLQAIAAIERLTLSTAWLEAQVPQARAAADLPAEVADRLRAAAAVCEQLACAVADGRPLPSLLSDTTPGLVLSDRLPAAWLPVARSVDIVGRLLAELPPLLAFGRDDAAPAGQRSGGGMRPPIVRRRLLTPACTLANTDALRSAAAAGLAAITCFLIYQALDSPELSTALLTTLLLAISPTVGAGARKALQRFTGALLGGIAALLTIVVVVPAVGDSFGAFLPALAFWALLAGWVTLGGPNVSYAGSQIALAFNLTLFATFHPSTDLGPALNRLLGILLGIGVFQATQSLFAPPTAITVMRRRLAAALRGMAALLRAPDRTLDAAARAGSWSIHQNIAAALAAQQDVVLELSAARERRLETAHCLVRVAYDVQQAFLAALLLNRAPPRTAADEELAPLLRDLQDLKEEAAVALAGLAGHLERRPGPAGTLDAQALARFAAAVDAALAAADVPAEAAAFLRARVAALQAMAAALTRLAADEDQAMHWLRRPGRPPSAERPAAPAAAVLPGPPR